MLTQEVIGIYINLCDLCDLIGKNNLGEDMAKLIKINHIGIAVNNIDEALPFWTEGLGMELEHVEEVARHVELVTPTSDDSTMAKYLADRGPGMHHLCLETDNIEELLAELKAKGFRLINETPIEEPGRKMAFVHPKATGGVLLELYEVTK
jgi:methylmalonyl-CoA/ethylmalonyl-CoA epimerase